MRGGGRVEEISLNERGEGQRLAENTNSRDSDELPAVLHPVLPRRTHVKSGATVPKYRRKLIRNLLMRWNEGQVGQQASDDIYARKRRRISISRGFPPEFHGSVKLGRLQASIEEAYLGYPDR